jgi:single-stranded-DNA-specific exonuclease
VLAGEDLGMPLAEELQALAPFGRGNPGVSLMLDGASFADVRPMGEGKHVRFTVQAGGVRARAVAFGTGGRLPLPARGEDDAPGGELQATFTLEVNEWNGVSEPRLVLRRAQWPEPVERAAEPEELIAPAEPDGLVVPEEPEELVLFALP